MTSNEPVELSKEAVVAQKVLDFLVKHSDLHDQSTWVDEALGDWKDLQKYAADLADFLKNNKGCGTTRCVAGQAVIEGRPDLLKVELKGLYASVQLIGDHEWDVEGEKILGLERRDAHQLFFMTENTQAIKALEYLAADKPVDWKEVFNNPAWTYPEEDVYTYEDWSDWTYESAQEKYGDPDRVDEDNLV